MGLTYSYNSHAPENTYATFLYFTGIPSKAAQRYAKPAKKGRRIHGICAADSTHQCSC